MITKGEISIEIIHFLGFQDMKRRNDIRGVDIMKFRVHIDLNDMGPK